MIHEVKTTLHGGPCDGQTVRVRVDGNQWQPRVQAADIKPLRAFDTAPTHTHTYAAVCMRKGAHEWCEYFYLPD